MNSPLVRPANLWRRRTLVLVLLLGVFVALPLVGIGGLGHWLVVADPLEEAEAVVVLSGHLPFRAMEAAALYREGWVPEVWLTRVAQQPEESALAQLGFKTVREDNYNRQILERLGVPPQAIRLLNEEIQNTADEVRLIAREVKRIKGRRVILVTSKPHTRRVRATWRVLVGETPYAIVRYSSADPYNPSQWWSTTRDALSVSRELFGLLNVWVGFPVEPDRHRSTEGQQEISRG